MGKKFADAARAELMSDITASGTNLAVYVGGGAFPVADTGPVAITEEKDWFKVVLQDATSIEIVYVRTHGAGSNVFSDLLRGQDGTAARAFAAGSVVGQCPTAADAAQWEEGGGVKYDFTRAADFTALANKGYWIAGNYTVTLPDSTGLVLGTTVHFMKAVAATPTIQVGAGGAVIKSAKGSDTAVLFDVDAELVVVFNGTDWEV